MKPRKYRIRKSYVSPAVWAISLVVMLLIGGLHTGLIILLVSKQNIGGAMMSTIAIAYWMAVSLVFTIVTRHQIRKSYEEPVRRIAKFASEVAKGDFSVYLSTRHTADRHDYLDILIQDLNKMVEDLGSIETLKTDFFSNVSHEIKTPLAVIQNTAELLKNESISPEERQNHVQSIIQSSRRLSALITNILKLNKLEKQTILSQSEDYDLCAQLCESALQFEQVWEDRNIEFDAELEDRAMILADRSLMDLVWNNLLSNAFKFTPDGGRVVLRQMRAADAVIVRVEDTGCGMNEETLRHIFDKFYQGDTSHATEGNGLGLALVKRILQLMNCEITVESAPGSGSIFTVRIPLQSNYKGADIYE